MLAARFHLMGVTAAVLAAAIVTPASAGTGCNRPYHPLIGNDIGSLRVGTR